MFVFTFTGFRIGMTQLEVVNVVLLEALKMEAILQWCRVPPHRHDEDGVCQRRRLRLNECAGGRDDRRCKRALAGIVSPLGGYETNSTLVSRAPAST